MFLTPSREIKNELHRHLDVDSGPLTKIDDRKRKERTRGRCDRVIE